MPTQISGTSGVSAPAATFGSQPDVTTPQSMVRLNTANGYGSTNTKIRRFSNVVVNQGSDITYSDSPTLGASFTINKSGVYAISYSDNCSGLYLIGVSLNTTQPATSVWLIPAAEILTLDSNTTGVVSGCSTQVYLPAGSVIRPHTDGVASSGTLQFFTITRVA